MDDSLKLCHHPQRFKKDTRASCLFCRTRRPSCILLEGSHPSFLPDVLPWALTSSVPYCNFPSPPYQMTQERLDFFFLKSKRLTLLCPNSTQFPLGILHHATPSKKEQKEIQGHMGKDSIQGISGIAAGKRLILGEERKVI